MRVEDLPDAATPFPGESIFSWLEATRVKLGLASGEWNEWCDFAPHEPERKASGQPWGKLPLELGHIDEIPAAWRIVSKWRRISCAKCIALEGRVARFPVLVDWLDARVIACSEHGLLLGNYPGAEAVPVTVSQEIHALHEWLEQWRRGVIGRQDARLRRDLVLAAGRNWDPRSYNIASAELGWAIQGTGWPLPNAQSRYRPMGPPRIGALTPLDRVAALLGAFRAWSALMDTASPVLPYWPTVAWEWLERRLRFGSNVAVGAAIGGILVASRCRRR